MSVPEVCRKLGICDAMFYIWRKKYRGISPLELNHMQQREEENLRLKKLVADLSLDKTMLQDVAGASARMGPGPAGTLQVSERQVCLHCKSFRYRSMAADDCALRLHKREITKTRIRYRRVHAMLRR